MGSLTTCLKKAGDAIDPGDKAAVIARARELRAKGLTPTAAAAQAVQEQLAAVRAMMEAESKQPDASKQDGDAMLAKVQNVATEAPDANTRQPQQLPEADPAQDRADDAAAGDRDRQPLDAGMAGSGEGSDLGGGVPERADRAGGGRARGPGQRDGQAPGETRDRAGVGPEPGAADDFDLSGEDIGTGGLTRKYRDNIAAIKILKTLDAEGRPATADERRALARYVGWGALKGVFDPANKQWAKEHAELRAMLTDRKWEAAKASTLNAHYTSTAVVNAMYGVLRRLGATRGRLLEPSVGSGNFLGLMPKDLRAGMQVFGVELDPITSKIAAGLYPSAKIRNQGFEDFDVPAGFFDIAVGNPPFGQEPLVDMLGSPYSGWSIHNYFFAKTIDKLRPGGVMAMVVSHNFLDAQDGKARKWIADRASLIGAVRLPRTAFKENAGTEVVTDILIFQKHDANGLPQDERTWLEVVDQVNTNPKTGDVVTHKVNRYFIENQGSVLGTPSAAGSMYGPNEYTVEPSGDLAAGLERWQATLPESVFEPIDRTEIMQADEVPDGVKVGSYFVAADGSIKIRAADEVGERRAMAWTAPNEKAAARVKGMVRLRDALREQMRLERSLDATSEQIEKGRRDLNAYYDEFKKDSGYLNDPTNRRLFLDDTEASLVLALEFDYDRGVSAATAEREGIEPRKSSANKADIFKRRVLFPPQDNFQVGSARDAMLASLNFRGTLDMPYMQKLYGKPADAIVAELGDLVFTDPSGALVTADDYLSGDVKTKLAEAEVAARSDSAMKRNVEALRKVIPEDKKPSEIHAAMGAKFIDGSVLEEFVKRLTGANVTAAYIKSLGQWLLAGGGNADPVLNTSRWGTSRAPALTIIQQTISGKSVVVTDTHRNADGSTTTTVNEKETEGAREKQRAIREEWQTWLWSDPQRAAKIAADYNEQMNRWVDRRYDGEHLTLPGKVPDDVLALLPHQKAGVWRALQSRQILLDHVVGAGKTFQMVAIAMELRRMGIARKPFFAVPNHLTLQWASEFARLYPGANVLAATPDDFAKGNREKFFSKIITGDWDAVIVGHSSLKKIGLPPDTERAVLEEQVREISDAIEDMKRARGDSRIVSDMQRIKKNLEGKMREKLAAVGKRDKVVTFDELGVDAFFVDELHEFKNLFYTSTMDRVPGMGNANGSAKAFDLFVKLQWMFNTYGSKAPIIGATGTPVSNSLVEMFNMQRFMQYPLLKQEGLNVFDAWARQFGSVENVYEVSPSGTGYRSSNRFSKFKNLGALMAHYNAFADVVTLDDLKAQEEARGKKFPVPKIRGGRPTMVVAERSPQVAMFMGVPQLEMVSGGRPLFGINFDDGETVSFVEKEGQTQAIVTSPRDGQAPVQRLLGTFPTEADARMAVVEAALSPKITVDPNSILGQFQNLRELTKQTKGKVNALSLTGAANKAGLDFRLIDPGAPDFPGSKINLAIDNMMTEYRRWSDDRGAQLVFCDLSVPLSERNNLASSARRLYVREDGVLVHKRGTMHTVEGMESLPFFLVQSGAGAAKTFDAYDAASGMLLRRGYKTRAEALKAVGDILADEDKRQRWIEARERTGEITQDLIDDYNDTNEIDTSESSSITLQDIAGVSASTAFSVYDDIRAKLIARGVPANEIAFIHDYGTPAAKDKLFKAVKRGDIRFLLGSTPKMGAGTNVQDRLVALHHIDAPWRPSDLEQREGRIIRRGNRLYERDPEGFEVGIYRYATKQTYDTRRWQILEHKARGIEQLRNYDGTTNEIDDIDGEAANAAEMKAAASGDPLILKETQLRNEVKRLENLQAAHADAVANFANKASFSRNYHSEFGPSERNVVQRLADRVARYPVPEDGLPEGTKLDGRVFTDRKEFTQAIARTAAEAANAGSPVQTEVSFRGLRYTINGSGKGSVRLEVDGTGNFGTSLGLWMPGEAISATGMVQRMMNYAARLPDHIAEINARIEQEREAEKRWAKESRKPFDQAQELADAREQHKRVQRMLIARGPEIPESQKPVLAKAQDRQRLALRAAGMGETLDELTAFSAGGAPSLSRAPRVTVQTDPDTGAPTFNGDGLRIDFPQETERLEFIDAGRVVNYAIMPSDSFDAYGMVELVIGEDGTPTALADIEIKPEYRGQGIGERAVAAILAAYPDADITISNIVEDARGFWARMGVPEQNRAPGEAYDSTLNWQTYSEAANGRGTEGAAEAGRATGEGRNARAEGRRAGPDARTQAGRVRGSDAAALRADLAKTGVKNVNIVQSVDDLPDSKRRAILAREPSGRVRGAYFPDDGSIWLVADNLNSPMEVAFVLMHEAFHRGIAKTLGADAKTVMRQMYLTNPRLNKLTRDLMALHGIGQDEAVEEALADLAGEGRARDLRGWDRLMKLIRDWLGKVAGALGAELRWSDDMIEDFVAGIRNVGLEGGVQVEAGGPGVTMSRAAGIITTKQIGSDLWAVVRNAGTGNEQHLGYHGNEADANEAAERARTEASRAPGRGARWWPANPAEPIQSAGGSGLDSVGRARALKTTLDGRKDAVSSRAEALELEQLPERAGFCFKLAAEASAAGVGDYVIGSAPWPDGNPIWHAVVMRDGAIYDPTFGRWFEPGVYESAGFTPHTTLTTQAVRDFIAASGGWAPDAGRLGIGDESGAKLSRAPGQNQPAWSSIRDARLPAGYIVNDFIESHGKLSWWSRTVGTMHNLAQRSPEFKRVYDAVQNFLGDVSLYATEAANEAPNLLPKLETFRDITKTPLSAEDTKAIAGPIFEGTLSWTRDENGEPVPEDDPQKAGIVWTDAELRDRFKLGDRQIKLYREFRSAVDKSLTDLIISDMLRYAGKDAEPVRDEVLSAMTPERAARILQEHLAELADAATPERAATLSNTGAAIGDKAAQARRLMDRGYAPLTRYGHYTLDVVDANGERVYFGLFESEAEANRMARRLREAHPGAQVAQGTLSERAYQLFAGVSPETMELFGNMLGLESQGDDAASRAFQEYLKLAKSNRSAMKRLIERKGIAGFSEDAGRVLAGFVYSNARQTAKNLHFGEITTATQAIAETKGKGQLLDAAVDLHQYVTNPREEAQQIKGLLFAQFLGGSIASAMVNLTQPLAVAMPYLSQWGGARRAATQVTRALKDALAWETTTDPARRTTGDKALDAAMKRAEEEGIVSPQEVHQLIAQAGGSGALQAGDGTAFGDALAKASNFRSKFMLAWGRPFSLAEQFNRRATYIAAYRTAVEEGQSDPAAFAARAIAETMFTYNKGNRPAWARGAIGSVLFTFKTYSISYVELMVRMAQSGKEGRRAALIGIATLALMSGLQGLPGADDLDDLIDGALQRMGYNFSSKRAKQEFLASIIGDDGARFVMTGLSGLPGVPIDVSGRLGLGNFIPGTGLLTKKDDYTRDALEVLGPVGSLAKQFGTAAGKIAEGEVWEGVKAALPVAAANAVKASDMASTGMYRDDRGRKVIDTDAVDAAFKAIGFQPTDVSRVQQASFEVQKMVSLTRIREAEIADKWARGMFDGNSDLIDEARAELARWNESNPATRIRITSKQLVDRLKNMRMGKTERIAKTAPREVRETVRRELEKAQ